MTENQFSTYSYWRAEPVIAHVGHDIGDVECMIIGIDFDYEMFQLIPIDPDLFEDEPFWYHFKFVDKKFKKPKMKVIYGSADVKPKRKDNRQIKFRGKDKAGKWLYGGLTQSTTDNGTECFIVQNDFSIVQVNPETVGQYTGLKGRNDKEIYEGDVLIGDGTIKFLVQYSEPKHSFCMTSIEDMNALPDFDSSFMIRNVWWERYRKTIIGNIYDNPELLKQKDNGTEKQNINKH